VMAREGGARQQQGEGGGQEHSRLLIRPLDGNMQHFRAQHSAARRSNACAAQRSAAHHNMSAHHISAQRALGMMMVRLRATASWKAVLSW
jgi:hypothetical protein